MNLETPERIRTASNRMHEAVKFLDAVFSDEWEHMEDSDAVTEELIDKVESVRDALAKQETLLIQAYMVAQAKDIERGIPNAMRMLEQN